MRRGGRLRPRRGGAPSRRVGDGGAGLVARSADLARAEGLEPLRPPAPWEAGVPPADSSRPLRELGYGEKDEVPARPGAVGNAEPAGAELPSAAKDDDAPLAPALFEGLVDLRRRILSCLFFAMVLTLGAFAVSDRILGILVRPGKGLTFVFLDPLEPFFTALKVSVVTGCVLALPWVLLQIRAVLRRRFGRRAEKLSVGAVAASTALFVAGALFAWGLVLPVGLDFLVSFGGPSLTARISIAEYTSFVLLFLLVFGLLAQMPIVLLVAASLGAVTSDGLARHRGMLVVGAFVVAAVVTPPDVVTQTLMALPMIVLLEITIVLMRLAGH